MINNNYLFLFLTEFQTFNVSVFLLCNRKDICSSSDGVYFLIWETEIGGAL